MRNATPSQVPAVRDCAGNCRRSVYLAGRAAYEATPVKRRQIRSPER